jgi:hypothetical protein
MSAASDEDLGRIALLEAIRREGEEWDVMRRATVLPIPTHRGKPVSSQCANVSQSTARSLLWTGAELRMRLQIPSMARCLLQKVSYSHSFIPCSTAGSWPREISPPACVPFDRGLKRLKAAVQVD